MISLIIQIIHIHPDNPDNADNPDNLDNPDNPDNPDNLDNPKSTKVIVFIGFWILKTSSGKHLKVLSNLKYTITLNVNDFICCYD